MSEQICEQVKFFCSDDNVRLDMLVSAECEITRNNAQKLIDECCVFANGKIVAKKSMKFAVGTEICVTMPPVTECSAQPQDIPIEIIYEDDDILIVNKAQGMVVHPAPGNPDGTLVNALMYHCKGRLSTINGVIRPGIVHRIDKDTSGLLVVAKNDASHTDLSQQIKEHSFKRMYNAVIVGAFPQDEGRIDLPIGRHPIHRKKMTVINENSKPAVTNYRVLEHFKGYSLCEFRLETGRTHQIRVHMQYIGHAVLGDPLYLNKNRYNLPGQALHARCIGFIHPKTNKYMEFISHPPEVFQKLVETLRNE